MEDSKTLLLSEKQIEQRLNRLAYQVYEDNSAEKEIIVAGIQKSGYKIAERISAILRQISSMNVSLAEVKINKHSQFNEEVWVSIPREQLSGKTIILVDDVLNSGKTMLYALKPFLDADIKKIRTIVLVDRNHKSYPIAADFVGHTLSTTLHDHVDVVFEGEKAEAWLSN